MLQGAAGRADPGQVVGLLGPSGAGKSTLLDILSRRKTQGRVNGVVCCNGHRLGVAFKRRSAYVPQVRPACGVNCYETSVSSQCAI